MRYLFIILLFVSSLSASGTKYFIQFGSFKNLKGLEHNIAKLPKSLRKHVVIVRSNGWYIPFAYYTSKKSFLTSKVKSYKRYFKDAHIANSSYMLKHPLIKNYATKTEAKKRYVRPKRVYVKPKRVYKAVVPKVRKQIRYAPAYQNVAISEADYILPQRVLQLPIAKTETIVQTLPVTEVKEETDVFKNETPKKYKHFTKQMLSGKSYYLAYKKSDDNPNLLIKVTFQNHEVTYQPIIGDMQMPKANYLVDSNRLYMFANAFTRNGSFSTLDEHHDDYLLVSSWADGKKLNSLRYYYKLKDAKKYLGKRVTTDVLSEILQEGDYDAYFINK